MSALLRKLRAWWRGNAEFEELLGRARADVSRLEDKVRQLSAEIEGWRGGPE